MSAVTYDWALLETEVGSELATTTSIQIKRRASREEEFQSALNTYLADYRRNLDASADKNARQLPNDKIPLGRRTAEMLSFMPWF